MTRPGLVLPCACNGLKHKWDELRAITSPLHSLLGEARNGGKVIQALLEFTIQNPMIWPEPYPWPTVCRALAKGCLRLLKHVDLESPGPLVLSPHCFDPLADIHNFSLRTGLAAQYYNCFDIHDVLQWLKAFPQPPFDVIHQWEEYQVEAHRYSGFNVSTHELEGPWTEYLEEMRSTVFAMHLGKFILAELPPSKDTAAAVVTWVQFYMGEIIFNWMFVGGSQFYR
ncbi:hypothetical protein DFH09DRAFT_1080026 [Mycena vulgaris]|nr:hypothetical protein DFH09DRAFT_1080026 [Mycena vulgaris]